MANNKQLGTNNRVREKVTKIKQLAREAAKCSLPQQLSSDDGAETQGLRNALHAIQEREKELLHQL